MLWGIVLRCRILTNFKDFIKRLNMDNFLESIVKRIYDKHIVIERFLLFLGFILACINVCSANCSLLLLYTTILYIMNNIMKYIKIACETSEVEKTIGPYVVISSISLTGVFVIVFFFCNALFGETVGSLAVKIAVILLYLIVLIANNCQISTEYKNSSA